ncbi:MAG: TetR/AcrR family transcriptional regulator [Humibacillus sp.]|nr:TetR/AcrR family transcriptional regulator [Humibacillus sp.]MDN5777601.1 TetR/AcrR family transcriptional regulator [Humibacillus sp.]
MSLSSDPQEPAPKRRRGAALEAALLDAAWDEILEKGYDRFTIESVAERARTSRAVVYRRWPRKADLVHAAATRAGSQQQVSVPNTGSLRDDVIELLRRANHSRSQIGVQMILQLGGYFAETGTGIAELRSAFLSGRSSAMQQVLDRAVARGEADPARLTPRVVGVPFDLYRQELLMTLKTVPDDVIESIVDEVFLPLVITR